MATRILYASHRPPYPFFLGGAARCAHRLLQSLAWDLGANCAAIGSAAYDATPWSLPPTADLIALGVRGVTRLSRLTAPGTQSSAGTVLDCGYPVQVLTDFPREMALLLRKQRPDVVWAQLEGAREVLSMARDHGVQGLLYVHDAEADPGELRAVANIGSHVVCSSAFLARRVAQVIGRPTQVIYPASDWYFGTVGDSQGFVTMVNPHAVKGLETFLEIAGRLPRQRFLLQESWKLDEVSLAALMERLTALPNVTFQQRVPDMRQVYSRTRLLLVPSVWEEGFGMVAVEAQSCGIPVIASARGGLPESVGEGGVLIDDYTNPATWVEAIRGLLDDSSEYRALAERAVRHARSDGFSARVSAQRFLEVCRGAAPVVDARYAAIPAAESRTRRSGLRALLTVFSRWN